MSRTDVPEFLARKLAREREEEQDISRLFAALHPRPGRLIIEQPRLATSHEQRRTASGLYAPDQAWRALREYGLRAKVLKIHPDDAATLDFREGDEILLPEHSGHPIYVERELPYWIIGIREVLGIYREAQRDALSA